MKQIFSVNLYLQISCKLLIFAQNHQIAALKQLNMKIFMIEENLYQELVEIRHYLHAHPEISEKEVETTKFIRQKLADWQIEIMDSQLKTGLVAKIGSGKPIIALRADIDALPILEETGLEFSSVNKGKGSFATSAFTSRSLFDKWKSFS